VTSKNTVITKCWLEQGAKRNSHSLLVGMKNSTATLEDGLMVSDQTKHTLYHTTQQSFYLAFTQRVEKCPHKKTAHKCL
jgi:hypothetical protein